MKIMIIKTCLSCGKQFEARANRRKYCSVKCAGKAISGTNHYKWKPKIQKTCEICGTQFLVFPCRANNAKFCSYTCMGISNKGKKAHNRKLDPGHVALLYLDGMTLQEIATQYNASLSSVSACLRKQGVPTREPTGANLRSAETVEKCRQSAKSRTGNKNHNFIDLPINEIAKKYRDGATTSELGIEYNVANVTIGRKLKKAGVKLRPPGFGRNCKCSDGHIVSSRWEQAVDEWLTAHNIPHIVHPCLPWNKRRRADSLVKDIYIEIWGMENSSRYEARKAEKIDNFVKHGIQLIQISPQHILNKDFSPLYLLKTI